METFLTYLAKSSLVIGLFYCCYQIFLRNETFFKAKRWFLVSGIGIALVFPFLIIKEFIEAPMLQIGAKIANTNNFEAITTTGTNSTDWWFVLGAIYLTGCVFFLVRFTIQLFSLYRLIKKGKHQKTNGFTMVEIKDDVSPFSFFNYIVFNPDKHSPEDLQTILVHEKAHSTQKHSIDMMLTHLLCIFQWANPFAWGYKKAITENLEYLADDTTTESLSNKKEYQYLLLGENITPNTSIPITNTFINSLIKKRIVMLNKSRSHKRSLLKMGIVLPLLIIALFIINTEVIAQKKTNSNETKNKWSLDGSERVTGFSVDITAELSDAELKSISKDLKQLGIDLKFKDIKRNSEGEIIAISSSWKKDKVGSGTMNLNGDKPINPCSFYFNKDSSNKILEIGYKMSKQPISNLSDNKLIKKFSDNDYGIEINKALIVINGKEMNQSFDVNDINMKKVSGVAIYKGAGATKKYGGKAKHGAIEINMKK